MVGTMALLTSLSMPTSVVEESCMRERRSSSPNSPVSARILAPDAKRNRRAQNLSGDAARRRQRHDALSRRSQHHREHSEDEDEESGEDYEDDEVEADEEDELDADTEENVRRGASAGQQHAIPLPPRRPSSRQQVLQQAASAQQQHQQQQLYSLRWHDFQASILSSFRHLRDVEDFVDVTLACDGKSFTAHKMVLSACSPYFRHLLKANPCQHPIVILRDVKYRDMEALLRFMYNGEVSVSNEQLPSVLHTARMLQVKGLADVPPTKHYPNKRVPDYSNETPSSRDSSAERRPASMNPSRKRARSMSPSPDPTVSITSSAAAVMAAVKEEDRTPLAPNENGQRDAEDEHDDDDAKMLDEKQQQQLLLDVHRDSLLSQALEGRSSQSLMAHLLATRMSGNQSETSSRSGGPGPVPSSAHQGEDDDASDSDDTDASDRDRTDVGDLSNTEDNVYPSSGLVGDHHLGRSSLPHPSEMIPPAGFAGHHPLLNLQSLHSLFPGGSMPGGNGSSGAGGLHAGRGLDGQNNNNNDLAARRSLDLMRIRATDPRPCPQCGKIYRSAHTLRTHLEDKHTVCPGYRCVLCGTVAKSRNSLHSHMSRQHRGISTKDLPVVPMPAPFDPVLASCLLAKAGVKVSPAELAARASPTSGNPRGRTADLRIDFKSPSGSLPPGTLPPQVTIGGLQSHRNNPLQLIPLDTDPEDLSLAQQRLRGDSNRDMHHHREKSGGSMTMTPYGPVATGLVNRLGLSGKMGKNWLETNMAAALQQQQQQLHQQAGSPNPNGQGNGAAGTGSALLDTYLQLIAEHSSNMAAVAAAAAAAQNAAGQPNNNNQSPDGDRPGSANPMEAYEKRSPKATASD